MLARMKKRGLVLLLASLPTIARSDEGWKQVADVRGPRDFVKAMLARAQQKQR